MENIDKKTLAKVAVAGVVIGMTGLSVWKFIRTPTLWDGFVPSRDGDPEVVIVDEKTKSAVLKQGYSAQKVPENIDAIVIGSGLGGLTTAALLAKSGKRVLVLEQHDQAGGCCHTFYEKGYEFDTGLHYVGDVGSGTMCRILFDFITDNKLQWTSMGDVYDEIVLGDPAKEELRRYPMRAGRANLIEDLIKRFPEEEEAIRKYHALCKSVKRSYPFYIHLKFLPTWLVPLMKRLWAGSFYKLANKTLEEVLDSLTSNSELKAVLSYFYGDYGAPPGKASFAMHALLVNHYVNGAYYPVGGPSSIAYNIIPVIERAGGKVLVRAEVSEIVVERGAAVGVRVKRDNNVIRAPIIVSAAGARATFDRLLPENMRESVAPVMKGSSQSHGHVSVMVGLKGDPKDLGLPSNNIWAFKSNDLQQQHELYFGGPSNVSPSLLFASFPCAKDPTHAARFPGRSTMLLVTEAPYHWFQKWEDARVKHRGDEYEKLKNDLGEYMLQYAYSLVPSIKGHVDYVEVGTPLSNNFYLGAVDGASYGLYHDIDRYHRTALRPQTPVKGLFLSGQDIMSCGVVGAMFGGLLAACEILQTNLFGGLISLMLKNQKKIEEEASSA